MNPILRSSVAATLLVAAAAASAADVSVMTQNQYLGGDIAPLIATAGTEYFNDAVVAVLRQVAANRTPERMAALAGQVRERNPALVGLQEVWKFECSPFPGVPAVPGYGCDDPVVRGAFNDHRALTEAALAGRYTVVAQVTNLDIQWFLLPDGTPVNGIPFVVNGVPALLRVTDRDLILARNDVVPSVTKVDFGCARVSVDGCNYEVVLELAPIGRIERGYVAVDATVDGVPLRFVNTHLETRDGPIPPELQGLQMLELLRDRVMFATPPGRTLVIVGDFNSDPAEPAGPSGLVPTPYWLAVGAFSLLDGWALRPGNAAGLTCCQAADLRNLPSSLSQRIDHVFLRELPARAEQVRVLGATANYRLPPGGRGLWPSDHGSVAARYTFR